MTFQVCISCKSLQSIEKYKKGKKTCLKCRTVATLKKEKYNLLKQHIIKNQILNTSVCRRCLKIKNNDEFGYYKQTKNGIDYYCKICRKEALLQSKKQQDKENYMKLMGYIQKPKDSSIEDIETQRKCNICSLLKPITEFNRDSKSKNGRRQRCKECEKKRRKEYTKRLLLADKEIDN